MGKQHTDGSEVPTSERDDPSSSPPPSPRPQPSPSQSALVASQRLRVAYLLACVGGYLDAYTYFERGGVFANAQTGNLVKLGIAIANGTSEAYLSYLLPILAFVGGIVAARGLEEMLTRRRLRLVRRSVLAVEIVVLGLVGLIPLGTDWDALANCLVSFVAALQYEAFQSFRGEAIVTTMSTGNLRKLVDSLFDGIVHHDARGLRRAALFASIICVFTAGAVIGTRACDALGRSAVAPAMIGLLCAVIVITMLRRRNAHAA